MTTLVVTAIGPMVTVQDLGRPGYARFGVTTSGAADRPALRLANRIVGNPDGAPALEVLLGGLEVRATAATTVTVTGAPTPVSINGRPASVCVPLDLRPGDHLRLGTPPTGVRSYLAVHGGFEVRRVLGSASTDPTAGVGPAPLTVGTSLSARVAGHQARDGVGTGVDDGSGRVTGSDLAAPSSPPVGDLVLRVILGPRQDWFETAAVRALTSTPWEVTAELDRVGVRLTGTPLGRARVDELPSEALVRGSVQVPPSGQPHVFLADHPTTGGYPVIAVVVDDDTDALAQVRPGARIRFRPVRPPWH